MISSMTAYAQAVSSTVLGDLSCELRSVNHRYLDIVIRLPEQFRAHEKSCHDLLSRHLERGRVECNFRLKETPESELAIDLEFAEKLKNVALKLQQELPQAQPLRAIDILKWPGVLQPKVVDEDETKIMLMDLLEQALKELQQGRMSEGEKITILIKQRLQEIQAIIEQVKQFLPEIESNYRKRIAKKLAVVQQELETSRVEQEMVLFLQKIDINEELDRLQVHSQEVGQAFEQDRPVGRKLDFFMQELHREANTLGAKSQDIQLSKASVELKVLIEQMREQVQNIE